MRRIPCRGTDSPRGCSWGRCSAAPHRWAGYSPLLGAEITLAAGGVLPVRADPSFEYGGLVDAGAVTLNGTLVETARLGYVSPRAEVIELRAPAVTAQTRAARGYCCSAASHWASRSSMWWNFIGRSHEEIVRYRANWQARIGAAPVGTAAGRDGSGRDGAGRAGPGAVRAPGRGPAAADPGPAAA